MWEKKKISTAMKCNLAGKQNQRSFSRQRCWELSYRIGCSLFATDQLQFTSMTAEVHLADGPTGFF